MNKGIMVADGIQVANQLNLWVGDYFGYLGVLSAVTEFLNVEEVGRKGGMSDVILDLLLWLWKWRNRAISQDVAASKKLERAKKWVLPENLQKGMTPLTPWF